MTVEVQRTPAGTTSLPEILNDICYQAGLQDGQFDCISNVDQTAFPGFCVTTRAYHEFAESIGGAGLAFAAGDWPCLVMPNPADAQLVDLTLTLGSTP